MWRVWESHGASWLFVQKITENDVPRPAPEFSRFDGNVLLGAFAGYKRATVARLFADPANRPLEVMWGAYQKIIKCYAEPDRRRVRGMMHEPVDDVNAGPTNAPREPGTLDRTLGRRLPDVPAYFDHAHSSNGPTEAVNGRLEHLRGIALGFTNLNNHITRSLLHAGGFRQTVQNQINQP